MSDKIRLTESIQIAHKRLDALEKRADHAEERRKELCADGEARDKDIKALEERVNCIAENLQELITAPGPLHARVKALEEHACGKIGVIALERSCGMADHQPAAPKPEATCGECRLFGECLRTMSKLNPEAEGCLPGNLLREAEERAKKNIVGLRQLVAEENAKHQMEQARAEKAEAKATQYEQDWYSAKSEFGDAMAKMRTRLREAEARVKELEDISHGTKAPAEESCEIQEKLCDSCMRRFRADERERVAQHFEDYPNWTKSFPASKDVVKVIRAMPDRGKPK